MDNRWWTAPGLVQTRSRKAQQAGVPIFLDLEKNRSATDIRIGELGELSATMLEGYEPRSRDSDERA